MTNDRIATIFEQVAALLEQQGASAHRVRAWRMAAHALRETSKEVAAVYWDEGRTGIERVPHIGPKLAAAVIELLLTRRCSTLTRLQGDSEQVLAGVPGIGPTLAARIHAHLGIETLEELELATHDGRLAKVPGFGRRRLEIVRDVLTQRLGRPQPPSSSVRLPPVELLLEVDAMYRQGAARESLPTVAPRRLNPSGTAWLPLLHTERDGWHFTALFSTTPLAHQRGRTRDWVVLLFHLDAQPEHQATVVTEWQVPLRGMRVVRGRERECREHYALVGGHKIGEGQHAA